MNAHLQDRKTYVWELEGAWKDARNREGFDTSTCTSSSELHVSVQSSVFDFEYVRYLRWVSSFVIALITLGKQLYEKLHIPLTFAKFFL